jgi:quercetin dioxygenase-like cupin family protein
MYVRLFTGDDGESHFEEIEFPFPAPQAVGAGEVNAGGVFYNRFPAGHDMGWNTAPRRQYVIGLRGNTLLTMRDGTSVEVRPGDVVLAEDVTGSGHHTRMVGNDDRVSLVIPIRD